MKLGTGLLAAGLALMACGEDGSDPHTFESGTYAVSDAALVSPNDECGLLGAYTDPSKQIDLTVNGSTVTFNLSQNPQAKPETLPKATLNVNAIEVAEQANYTIAVGDTCVMRVRSQVTGEVLEENTAQLTLAAEVTEEAGDCSANGIFDQVPCSSTYRFVATKVQAD